LRIYKDGIRSKNITTNYFGDNTDYYSIFSAFTLMGYIQAIGIGRIDKQNRAERRDMKLLHTSDWHLGRALHGRKRYEKYEAFLNWLAELIADKNIDVLLGGGRRF